MLLQNCFNSINAQIQEDLEEIAKLQARVTQLQAHAQEIQGAEQAAESALAQIDTVISMLQAICPEEINVFMAAIDAKFLPQRLQLQGVVDNKHVVESDTTPLEPDTDGIVETTFSVVIDDSDNKSTSEVAEVDSNTVEVVGDSCENDGDGSFCSDDIKEDDVNGNGNGNDKGHTSNHSDGDGHHLLTYSDLRIVDRPTLIKLANSHNLPGFKSKKRDELATLLDGMVSSDELASVQNGKH